MIGNSFRFFRKHLAVNIRSIFTVIINAGIHQDAFKPAFKGDGNFHMPVLVELVNVFEKFGKSFIDNFFNLAIILLIAVTDFYGISLQKLIQFLLAGPVILPAAG